ncbi:hypothetical protein DENSPDRAFT_410965 [Dentipellis sp. KUC8613]|nr:hypothetical protein DENSPDRAFT_410965 [Dentipellis sp. KUC8613]
MLTCCVSSMTAAWRARLIYTVIVFRRDESNTGLVLLKWQELWTRAGTRRAASRLQLGAPSCLRPPSLTTSTSSLALPCILHCSWPFLCSTSTMDSSSARKGAQSHMVASSVVDNAAAAQPQANQPPKQEKINRPMNSFLCFRAAMSPRFPGLQASQISVITGKLWRAMSDEERAVYTTAAQDKALEHKVRYPNYEFHPRTATEKEMEKSKKRLEGMAKKLARPVKAKARAVDRVKATYRQQSTAAPVAPGAQGPSPPQSNLPMQHLGMPSAPQGLLNACIPLPLAHPLPPHAHYLPPMYPPSLPHPPFYPPTNFNPYYGLPYSPHGYRTGAMMPSDMSQQQYQYSLQSHNQPNLLAYHSMPHNVLPSEARAMLRSDVSQPAEVQPPHPDHIHGSMHSLGHSGYQMHPSATNGLPQNTLQNFDLQAPRITVSVSQTLAVEEPVALDPPPMLQSTPQNFDVHASQITASVSQTLAVEEPVTLDRPPLPIGTPSTEAQESMELSNGAVANIDAPNTEDEQLEALMAQYFEAFVNADEPSTQDNVVEDGPGPAATAGQAARQDQEAMASQWAQPVTTSTPDQTWSAQHHDGMPYPDPRVSGPSQDATAEYPTNVSQGPQAQFWFGPYQ